MRIQTEAARILGERGVNPEGKDLDRKRLGRSNLITLIAALNTHANALVGRKSGERSEFSREDLDRIDRDFDMISERAIGEIFDG